MARKGVESRWRELVDRQAESGLSVREFCSSQGVSEPSFYSWRRRLRECEEDGAPEAAGVDPFVSVKLREVGPPLEIVHPLGYRIQVRGAVDAAALRQVIRALDERGAQ